MGFEIEIKIRPLTESEIKEYRKKSKNDKEFIEKADLNVILNKLGFGSELISEIREDGSGSDIFKILN